VTDETSGERLDVVNLKGAHNVSLGQRDWAQARGERFYRRQSVFSSRPRGF